MRERATKAFVCMLPALVGGHVCAQTLSFTEIGAQAGANGVYECASGYPGNHHQMVGGACVADFNNDGWPDLFAPAGGIEPDRLYINRRDGTFEDRASAWGIDQRRRTGGVAAGMLIKTVGRTCSSCPTATRRARPGPRTAGCS